MGASWSPHQLCSWTTVGGPGSSLLPPQTGPSLRCSFLFLTLTLSDTANLFGDSPHDLSVCVRLLFQPTWVADRSWVAAAYQSRQLYRAGRMQNETSANDMGWNISGQKKKNKSPFYLWASETSFAYRLPTANQLGPKPRSGCFSRRLPSGNSESSSRCHFRLQIFGFHK